MGMGKDMIKPVPYPLHYQPYWDMVLHQLKINMDFKVEISKVSRPYKENKPLVHDSRIPNPSA